MKKRSLALGALILFFCNFVSRVLGFAYKIILVRILVSEGIGLTEMVSPCMLLLWWYREWAFPLP